MRTGTKEKLLMVAVAIVAGIGTAIAQDDTDERLSALEEKVEQISGKSGMTDDGKRLILTDAERHRMTLGVTFGVRNPYFPTEIRVNYENYWYPQGGAKESEQDKIVCELMIKF